MAQLNVKTDRADDVLRLTPAGELDMHVAPGLREILHRELKTPPPEVVVDLANVPFIDSSIIATLVDGLKIARAKDIQFRVENCQPAVRDTFEIARLLESFRIG
ncbi:MAG: STAS domain-containing protein [Planctomycetota bacterium]|nr:STAS domain-containing protein [Planctomycetota bacterium]